MDKLNFGNGLLTPPATILPVLHKLKDSYLLWFQYYQILPKTHRYSLGMRVDTTMIEAVEAIAAAAFLSRGEKLPFVRRAIQKIDTVKILLMVLWEAKSLEDKPYIALSEKLLGVGKMLGGWQGQIMRQNSPGAKPGEK